MVDMERILRYMGKSTDSPVTLRAILDPKFAQRVIGAQGNVHQYIQTTHAVKLYLQNDEDKYGRLCSIAGPVKNVARAWNEVMHIIFYKIIDRKQRIWLKLLIPSELSLKLQQVPSRNTSGCILNDICNETETRITIQPTPLINTTEHFLEISTLTGDLFPENFIRALSLLGRQFQIYRHEALSPSNVYYTPFCYNRAPMMDDENEDESEDDDDNDDDEDDNDYYDYRKHSDVKNGKRPQYDPQMYHQNGITTRSTKEKGKSVLHTVPESSTSPPAPTISNAERIASIIQQSWALSAKAAAESASASSSTSHLDPIISSCTVSPKSILQQHYNIDYTSSF